MAFFWKDYARFSRQPIMTDYSDFHAGSILGFPKSALAATGFWRRDYAFGFSRCCIHFRHFRPIPRALQEISDYFLPNQFYACFVENNGILAII